VRYIEADLPDMAARKRAALPRMASLTDHHQVRAVDALKDDGPDSLVAVTADLDTRQGLAIITEGLLGYLPLGDVEAIWQRFARAMEPFPTGRYISDLHLGSVATVHVRAFRLLLSAFVRGRVYQHFSEAREAEAALVAAGFGAAHVGPAHIGPAVEIERDDRDPGSRLANILEASITLPPEVSPT
jgi:O-methyltransferase involved in polyketide biosynthesis